MVYFAADTFTMGSAAAGGDEAPEHAVTLSAYCLDRTEVTASAYDACVTAGACAAPPTGAWKSTFRVPGLEMHPVNWVDWADATSYCAWRGLRLPTEAEWEHAARPDGRTYPWGEAALSATLLDACGTECVAHFSGDVPYADPYPETAPVGSFPAGASADGVLDLEGNVGELCSDWYGPYASGAVTDPTGPATGTFRVRRGAAWEDSLASVVHGAYRFEFQPGHPSEVVGFRCASDGSGPRDGGTPDLGTSDAGPPPTDLGTDMGRPAFCGTTTGTASLDVHVVFGPEPVTSAASVALHLESVCGTAFDVTTDAAGTAHVDLDRANGPWTLTAASPGHDAVSILAVSELPAFDGDIRLDPTPFPAPGSAPASGHVTGTIASGHSLRVDCFDFGTTMTDATGNWSSSLSVFPWAVPVQFSAVELDAAGNAVNGVLGASMTRSAAGVSGVALAMPSPATPPELHPITVHGLPAGCTPTTAGGPELLLDTVNNDPYVFVGSATYPTPTTVDARWFTAIPPNVVFLEYTCAGSVVHAFVHDLTATDFTIPSEDSSPDFGTSLGDVVLYAPGPAGNWDAIMLDVGESGGVPPRWRIIVPPQAAPRTTGAPHLPAGMTTADLGLFGSVSSLALYVKMDHGRVWSTMSSGSAVSDWSAAIGGTFFMLDVSSR